MVNNEGKGLVKNLEKGVDITFFMETSYNSKPYHLMFYKHMITTVLKKETDANEIIWTMYKESKEENKE